MANRFFIKRKPKDLGILGDAIPKYRAKKTIIDNITFDSKAEGDHYLFLKARLQAGEIEGLKTQVPFILLPSFATTNYWIENKKTHNVTAVVTNKKGENVIRSITYQADFVYFDRKLNKRCVVDTKGYATTEYIIKRKMLLKLLQLLQEDVNTVFIEVKK